MSRTHGYSLSMDSSSATALFDVGETCCQQGNE